MIFSRKLSHFYLLFRVDSWWHASWSRDKFLEKIKGEVQSSRTRSPLLVPRYLACFCPASSTVRPTSRTFLKLRCNFFFLVSNHFIFQQWASSSISCCCYCSKGTVMKPRRTKTQPRQLRKPVNGWQNCARTLFQDWKRKLMLQIARLRCSYNLSSIWIVFLGWESTREQTLLCCKQCGCRCCGDIYKHFQLSGFHLRLFFVSVTVSRDRKRANSKNLRRFYANFRRFTLI